MAVNQNITRLNPIAQTFAINSASGAYLTKIGLFFSAKAAASDLPVQVHLRPAFDGSPDASKILENSIVYKGSSSITTSTDATVETTFTFPEPVFVEGNKEYALVVTSNAEAGGYKVWTSKLGSFELGSTTKRIQADPFAGVFFKSSNGSTFEADQTRDLTFKVYRAKFGKQGASIRLNAAPPPVKLLDSDPFEFTGSDASLRVFHSNHGFQVNDIVTLSSDSSGLSATDTVNGVLGSSILGSRTVTAIDNTGYKVAMDSAATSSIFGGGGGILATEQYIMDTYKPNIETMVPPATGVVFAGTFTSSKSLGGNETAYGTIENNLVMNKEDNGFVKPQVITTASRDASLGRSSTFIDVITDTFDDFVAPTVDLQRATLVSVHNIIDNQDSASTSGFNVPLDFVAETVAGFGSSSAKHITQPVVLAEAATGIKVLIDANRPNTAGFDLYFRTLPTGADTPIEDVAWTEVSNIEPTSNYNNQPSDNNPSIFREYRYTIGGDFVGTLVPFNTYQLKLVMNSTSSTTVPRFKALRTIALGT